MIKIVKKITGFHYLLTEKLLDTLIPEVLNKIRNKSITHNIFRIQDNKFIMCGILC